MDSNIGRKLDDRYEITELIGVGGMADVYKATDVMENKVVAVKILKNEYSQNDEFVRRFRNESKAIAVLSHPNIVKIYDVGFTDEIQFIVMEYIDGITLKELLEQQGVLRWKDALKFVVQILKALQHAHDKGIVHRDIKPQNIMLFPDGTIKVMDFGIARFSRVDSKTISDKTIGSVHYISPEQARGENTDERSDIYSVGVVLYEMLTGRKPFDGENPVAIAMKHIQDTAVAPRDIMPSIPEALEEIVLHAMERSPARRYQSAAEMINDISAFKVNPSIVFGYKNYDAVIEDDSSRIMRRMDDDDDEDEDEDDDYYDEEEEVEYEVKRRSYVIPILLAMTVAVVIIAATSIVITLFKNFDLAKAGTSNVTVQNFVGQNFQKVRQEYSDKLTFNVTEEWNNDYAEGVIIEQSVTNRSVKEGFTLDVTVSKGPRMIEIPDLSMKTEGVATSELKSAGFLPMIKQLTDESGQVPEGLVIRTQPEAGTKFAAGGQVIVFVSQGQVETEVKVPNVVGKTEEKAIKLLRDNKLVPVVEEVKREGDKGKVVEQSHAEGSFWPKGTEVTIYVSTGELDPSQVILPLPIPSGANGAYTISVLMDGNTVKTQAIEKAETVAGGNVNVEISGKKIQSVIIEMQNNSTKKSITYAKYTIDFSNGNITTDQSPDTKALLNITPTATKTSTTTEAPSSQAQPSQTTTPEPAVTQPPATTTPEPETTTPEPQVTEPEVSDPAEGGEETPEGE